MFGAHTVEVAAGKLDFRPLYITLSDHQELRPGCERSADAPLKASWLLQLTKLLQSYFAQ